MSKKQPTTLPFLFTPADSPAGEDNNPHAKASTNVGDTLRALADKFGEGIEEVVAYAGERTVRVDRTRIIEVLTCLKEELGFTYLSDLGGIDRFTEDDRYEIMYNLVNMDQGKRIRIVIRVDEDSMTVPSATAVYKAANWNEREVWDMFGIRFEGHNDLRRMFLPEDFEYHPLRKEFPLLGVPGSLPLPPQTPSGGLTLDPFARAHGNIPPKSFNEPVGSDDEEQPTGPDPSN